jgi:flagellar secretion chaperone FliS
MLHASVHPPRPAAPHAAALQRAALREYRTVDLEARLASASPHMLVVMLYDKLASTIGEARAAALAADAPRRLRATEKALALVDGLDATLDDRRGGEVAQSLHQVYALVHARLLEGSAEGLSQALSAVQDIAQAWAQIAPKPRAAASL